MTTNWTGGLAACALGLFAAGAAVAQTADEPATAPAGEGAVAEGTAPMGGMGPMGPMDGMGPGVPGLLPLALYDTDGDGAVTREEIEAARAARFAEADANGDGALDATELLALQDAAREAVRLAQAEAVVTRMDDDGDGLLQEAELADRQPQLAPIFDRLDADGDGAISQDEMAAMRGPMGEGHDMGRGGMRGMGFGGPGHGHGGFGEGPGGWFGGFFGR